MKPKLHLVTLILLCTIVFRVQAQDDGYSAAKQRLIGTMHEQAIQPTGKFQPKVVPNNTFLPGEELNYVMHYGIITGARAKATLKETTLNGKKVYHSKAEAETVGIADVFYNVHDVYESYFDAATNLPVKAIRNIKEGRYRFYNEVTFYHEKDSVYSSRAKSMKSAPGGLFDIISAFYYGRRVSFNDLKKDDIVRFTTYFDDRVFVVEVKYRGIEVINTRLGKVRCMKFNPLVEPGRVFDTENDVTFWVSDDKNYIPIRIQMNLMVGSFKIDLDKYKGLKHPLPIIK